MNYRSDVSRLSTAAADRMVAGPSRIAETDEMFKSRRRKKYEKLKDLYQTLGGSETDLERQTSEMGIDREQGDRNQTKDKPASDGEVQNRKNLDQRVKDEEIANSPKEYKRDVNFRDKTPTLENDESKEEEPHRETESDQSSQLEDIEEEKLSRTSTRGDRERDDKTKDKYKEDFEPEETENFSDFESEDQGSFRTDSMISERDQTIIEEESEDEGHQNDERKEETVSDHEKDEKELERSNSSISNSDKANEKDPQKATETESNEPTEEQENEMKLEDYEERESVKSISPVGKTDENSKDLEETKAGENIEDLEETNGEENSEDPEETKGEENSEDPEETKGEENNEDLEETQAEGHSTPESEEIPELLNEAASSVDNENANDMETENTDEIEQHQQNSSEIINISTNEEEEEQESTRVETTNVPMEETNEIQSWREMDEKNLEKKKKNFDIDEYWDRMAARTSALRRARIERNELQKNPKSEDRFLLSEEDSDLDGFCDLPSVSGDRNVRNTLQAEQHFAKTEPEGITRPNKYSGIPSYGGQRIPVRTRPIYRSRQPDYSDWFTSSDKNRLNDNFNVSTIVKDEIRSFESEGVLFRALRKQELDRENERLANAMKNKSIGNPAWKKTDDGDLQEQKKKTNDKQGTDDKKEIANDSPQKRGDEFLESWMKNIDKKLDRLARFLPVPPLSAENNEQTTRPTDKRISTLQRGRAAWASNESKEEPEELLHRRNRHTLPVTELERRRPQPPTTGTLLPRRASRQHNTISQTSAPTNHFLPDLSPSRKSYGNPGGAAGQHQTMTRSRNPVKSNVDQWTFAAGPRPRNGAAGRGKSQPPRILVPWR